MKGTAWRLFATSIAVLAGVQVLAGPAPSTATALHASVRNALAAPADNLDNRYAQSVWLKTMSARLKPYIKDAGKRKKLLLLVRTEAARAKVPVSLVLAMINVESDFKPWAVSPVGAQGLMQIMPFWMKVAGKPGDNLFNQQTNVRIGCTILAYYLQQSHGDLAEALQRYYGKRFGTAYTTRVLKLLNSRWYWKN